MNFLFHTILYFNDKPVYYNVYKNGAGFFAEMLDNPENVTEAINFKFDRESILNADQQMYQQTELIKEELNLWIEAHGLR